MILHRHLFRFSLAGIIAGTVAFVPGAIFGLAAGALLGPGAGAATLPSSSTRAGRPSSPVPSATSRAPSA